MKTVIRNKKANQTINAYRFAQPSNINSDVNVPQGVEKLQNVERGQLLLKSVAGAVKIKNESDILKNRILDERYLIHF